MNILGGKKQIIFVAALFCVLSFVFVTPTYAQETASCVRNDKGDVICPSGVASYGNPGDFEEGGNIFNPGNPIFRTPIGRDFLIDLTGLFLNLSCGLASFDMDLSEYLMNSILMELSLAGDIADIDVSQLLSNACSAGGMGTGGAGQGAGGDMETLAGTCAERIAGAARNKVGYSTADVPGTHGGSLACAWAVSTILNDADAGYGGGQTTLGTQALSDGLEADACYEIVDTGYITSDEAVNLQPGDVLVTPTNFDRSGASSDVGCRSSHSNRCNSGHTGIYIGNGEVISNGSRGFEGSSAGISQNYTVDTWNGSTGGGSGTGVIPRNVPNSKVFRNICNDCGGGSGDIEVPPIPTS